MQTTPKEKEDITVLLFLSDFDMKLKEPIIQYIQQTYSDYLQSGFLKIMQVNKKAYPPLEGLKHNFNDEEDRVKWRSKQVVDFAYMFLLWQESFTLLYSTGR